MQWYLAVWKQYTKFSGRSRRKEFWTFLLIHLIVILAFTLLLTILENQYLMTPMVEITVNALIMLYVLASIAPTLAVYVRRLHDTGRSGWWYFISFVPVIGSLLLLFWCAQDSHTGENKYGPNPKS